MSKKKKNPWYSGKKELCRRIFLSSTYKPNTYLFVRVDERNPKKKEIVARVYKSGGKWFLWYEKANYRVSIENFSQAIRQVEKEF